MHFPSHWFKGLTGTLVILMAGVSLCPSSAPAQTRADAGVLGATKKVRSMKEIRGERVVRQKWEMSCGAAALSTLLTYEFKDNTPETAIVVWILHRVDPVRVRARGGFSLLDLKRFAQARGYTAEGFTGMSMEELAAEKSSVIVPIRIKGFDHFVVVRGIADGRVDIADPGFGNITMRVDRFQTLWKEGIVFIVHPPSDLMMTEQKPLMSSQIVPDATIIQRGIGTALPANMLY
ncbi:C39 family peptidase [Edaphobacter aggregans]|uniref:C39 family peptidase n=1 Tax=Edaphobacter aggregans TaxID=570835 RepID=UPI00068A22DA|nr:C39 family peptidase [Edaphobacter aggregans]